MSTYLSDDPVDEPSDDLLGREPLATSIATLIASAPDAASFRIGILGTWGSGKTSVLRLVRARLMSNGHVCVWSVPWTAPSALDATEQLLASVCVELGLGKDRRLWTSKLGNLFSRAATAATAVDHRLQVASKVLSTLLGGIGAKIQDRLANALLQRVVQTLGKRRLVVLVDDLDRARPEMIPDLLLILREALSLPGFHYVLALDPDVVACALEQAHHGYKDAGQSFLDKIIEYPFYLPPPSGVNVDRMTRRFVEMAGGQVDEQALRDMSSYLPRNPRSLKLFLRYLSGLSSQTARFSPHEVPLRKLYLAQLLRLEFPREAHELAEDSDAVGAIDTAMLESVTRGKRAQKDPPSPPKETEHAPTDPVRRRRFLSICGGLREAAMTSVEYSTGDLIRLMEQPPRITLKELDTLVDELTPLTPERREFRLRELVVRGDGADAEFAASLFRKALAVRDRTLGFAVDQDTLEATAEALLPASPLADILHCVLVSLRGLDEGLIGPEDWTELVNHCARWSKFRGQGLGYDAARADELRLLREAAAVMHRETKVALLGSMMEMPSGQLAEVPEPFENLARELNRDFREAAVDVALARFEQPEGVSVYWGQRTGSQEKAIVFSRDSPFHSPSGRARLRAISDRARGERAIQENFLTYLRMILYGAADQPTSFAQDDCLALLGDQEFIDDLWNAAIASPLNLRTVGSLRESLARLDSTGRFAARLKRPDWWTAYERDYFTSDDDGRLPSPSSLA